MNSLYFHQFKTLGLTLLIFLSLMVLLLVVGSAARFLAFAVENGLSLFVFLRMLLSLIPIQMSAIFPLCLLAAALATFVAQTTAGEFSILRAAGVSEGSYFAPALTFGAAVALIYGFLTFYIAPFSEQNLDRIQEKSAAVVTQNTVINAREPVLFNGVEVFVNTTNQSRLNQASFFRLSPDQTALWYYADTAQFFAGPNGLALLLDNSLLGGFDGPTLQATQTLDRAIVDLGLQAQPATAPDASVRTKHQTLAQLLRGWARDTPARQQASKAEIFERGAYTLLVFAMPSWVLFWLLAVRHSRHKINRLAYLGPIILVAGIMLVDTLSAEINFSLTGLVLTWLGCSTLIWAGPLWYRLAELKMSTGANQASTQTIEKSAGL